MWDSAHYFQIIDWLQQEQEEEFRHFQEKLIPTKNKIWGVRTDKLRKKAREIASVGIRSFLEVKRKDSFEEVLLEGFVLGMVKEPDLFWSYLESYLPKVDNWASCDMACSSFRLFKKKENRELLKPRVVGLLFSKREFTVRVGVVLLMDYYMDEVEEVLSLVDSIKTNAYYVQMAIAWLVSVALVKNYDVTFTYLKNDHLDLFTHNKAIQKARESRRLTDIQKAELLSLKRSI